MSAMEKLSDLPPDMLVEISKLLTKVEDFVSFRSVSKSLLAAANLEYFEGLRLRKGTPYLMLPGNGDIGEFYSLGEDESIVASFEVPKFNNKKCFESLGWLLIIEEDGNMSLLDPFSGNEILLPHQKTFPEYINGQEMDAFVFIQKMVLSSSPNETSDFILMVIAGGVGDLCFWRLGDKAWNKIYKREGSGMFTDVVYYGDRRFYAIGYPGFVWRFDFAGNDNLVEGCMIISCKDIIPDVRSLYPNVTYDSMNLYILKTIDDRLLMIMRSSPNLSQDGLYYMTSKFRVYEIDISTRQWKEIYSLGRMAVFLGQNSTIAVDASIFTGKVKIKANHIYFTDDDWDFNYFISEKGGGKNIGVYNLKTSTVEPIHLGERVLGLTRFCTSVWITRGL